MKKIILLLLCLSNYMFTFADTEPDNDSPSGADIINENGSVTGTTTALNYDYYELNTSGDGNITVTLDAITSTYMYVRLYDTIGNQLGSNTASSGGGPVSFTVYQLGAGKYYIVTVGNGADSYTVSNSVDLLTTPNDPEPNNSPATAIPIIADDSTRGHISYRNPDGTYDLNDYYILTTPVDGDIAVSFFTNNGNPIDLFLIDTTGQTIIGSSGAGGNSFTNVALAAGTYYIRVYVNLTTQYCGYNVSYHLTPTEYDNDVEPNGVYTNASILLTNDSTTGHLMHRNIGGGYDLMDWYKIETSAFGDLSLALSNSNNNYIGVTLYDSTASTVILTVAGPGQSGLNLVAPNLIAGTYYAKVYANLGSEYCGYILSNNFNTTGINDLSTVKGFEVFPNPTSDNFTLKFFDEKYGEKEISVTDIYGRICFATKINSLVGENLFPVETDFLTNGIYFVSLSSGSFSKQKMFSKN